jgi:hypothetical protein
MKPQTLLAALLLFSGSISWAEDSYYHVPLNSLTLTEGSFPTRPDWNVPNWEKAEAMEPYAVLDGDGEVYLSGEPLRPWSPPNQPPPVIAFKISKGSPLTGRLFMPKSDLSGMVALKFKVDASQEKTDSKQEFFKAKENFYRRLRERNLPGAAWFRHQETEAAKAHDSKPTPGMPGGFNPRRGRAWEDNYDPTYDLFSGGRALSENLQLDRVMAPTSTNGTLVALTNLHGITVRQMDWKALLTQNKPELDPLAAYIPFDQHALFFFSFEAMTRWIEEADHDGTPVLQMFEPRAEDANSRGRYQKQLCLELNELSRLLGPKLITSIAFTGSDPYLRTGSDIGVLYETTSAMTLKALIQSRQAGAQQANPGCQTVKGEIDGVPFSGVVSPDRAVSSYIASLENIVLISNSRAQLERLISVAKGKTQALTTQDEYVYFRRKYARSGAGESGFLVLSDATIRRWCGPRWRIANSRRTRAAAALAEFQAANLDELSTGQAKPGCIATNMPGIGEVFLTASGVSSPIYGSLAFLTPILELPLTEVTQGEADAYNRWCTGYQQNWSQMFDPIAIRFALASDRLSAEVCVMPLIAGSDYRQLIAVSTGAHIAPNAGDPHPEALVHLAYAINPESETIKSSGNFLGGFSPSLRANPLGWLGQCLAIYADQDPFWANLAKATNSSNFLEKNYPSLPVALYCEVKNPLGLTAFLATVRAFAEQTAPRMTVWENLEYSGQAYVKVSAGEAMQEESGPTNLCIYYAVTPRSLVLTLSETVLKRALDRQRVQLAAKQAGTNSVATSPWLGTNLCLRIDQSFVPILETLCRDEFRPAQQRLAWGNIPILNEWKRRYPKQDPIKLHEQFWQTTLVCPGGGRYVWNDQWRTMESTVYGHPGEPKAGPESLLPVTRIKLANLGISFENMGLSAKAVLEREVGK